MLSVSWNSRTRIATPVSSGSTIAYSPCEARQTHRQARKPLCSILATTVSQLCYLSMMMILADLAMYTSALPPSGVPIEEQQRQAAARVLPEMPAPHEHADSAMPVEEDYTNPRTGPSSSIVRSGRHSTLPTAYSHPYPVSPTASLSRSMSVASVQSGLANGTAPRGRHSPYTYMSRTVPAPSYIRNQSYHVPISPISPTTGEGSSAGWSPLSPTSSSDSASTGYSSWGPQTPAIYQPADGQYVPVHGHQASPYSVYNSYYQGYEAATRHRLSNSREQTSEAEVKPDLFTPTPGPYSAPQTGPTISSSVSSPVEPLPRTSDAGEACPPASVPRPASASMATNQFPPMPTPRRAHERYSLPYTASHARSASVWSSSSENGSPAHPSDIQFRMPAPIEQSHARYAANGLVAPAESRPPMLHFSPHYTQRPQHTTMHHPPQPSAAWQHEQARPTLPPISFQRHVHELADPFDLSRSASLKLAPILPQNNGSHAPESRAMGSATGCTPVLVQEDTQLPGASSPPQMAQ